MNIIDPPKYFTRHLLKAGLQCPAKLYYNAHQYPEDQRIKPFLDHAGFNKYHLKKLLSQLYPGAILIKESSRRQAAEVTARHLHNQNIILLDAAFLHNDCFVKVPVLIKQNDHFTLVDLKTKAINPKKHRLVNHHGKIYKKWKPYITDLAYKKYCVKQLYNDCTFKMELLLPDKTNSVINDRLLQRIQNGIEELKDENLFYRLDVTNHVNAILEGKFLNQTFGDVVEQLKKQLMQGEWPNPIIGKKCGKCEFRISEMQQKDGAASGFNKCWMNAEEVQEYSSETDPVLDLIGPGIDRWMDNGIYLKKNVSLQDLPSLESIMQVNNGISQKQRQTLQVRQAKEKEIPEEIVKDSIPDELNRWEYPLHFLDFEAGNYAVPIRKNRRPYHLVVFQFSCHTLHADGSHTHHQWIDDMENGYPNYELVRQLKKVPYINEGTIIQYSKFEHYALKTIRKELKRESSEVSDASTLIDWLNNMVQRRDSDYHSPPYLADLSRLVKNFYFNKFMGSSLSIKDVIQSVLTVSDFLKEKYTQPYKSANFDGAIWWQWDKEKGQVKSPYQILKKMQQDVGISRGTEAMVTYGRLLTESFRDEKKADIKSSLLKYCELDTLAMVMLYEHWKNLETN